MTLEQKCKDSVFASQLKWDSQPNLNLVIEKTLQNGVEFLAHMIYRQRFVPAISTSNSSKTQWKIA